MQARDVDDQIDRLTLRRGGSGAQPGQELRVVRIDGLDGLELVVPDIVREFLRVLGDHGRRVDREVRHDVRAE